MRPIHVGIPISYDYKYLPLCLVQIYETADKITLAIDKNRKTWAGMKYEFDEAFLSNILANDPLHKISLYEDDFSIPELSSKDCEKRERRMIRQFMKSEEENAWHLQIDTDEYFIDFNTFVNFLHEIERYFDGYITVKVRWKTIFKLYDNGIVIAEDNEGMGYFPVASYGGFRWNPTKEEIVIGTDFGVLHQSWGRNEEEVKFKISNWGHCVDFDTEAYFEFWKSVNRYNAPYIHDCHPLGKYCGWNRLQYVDGSIQTVIDSLRKDEPEIEFHPSIIRRAKRQKRIYAIRSNRVVQMLKPLIKDVIGKR